MVTKLLRYLSREQGLVLDDNTQKLINQAEEQGLIEEAQMETNDIMLAGFGEIIKALGGDIPAAMQKAMGKMEEFGQEGQEAARGIGRAGAEGYSLMEKAGNRALDSLKGKVQEAGEGFKRSFADGVSGAIDEVDRLGKKIRGTNFGANISIGVEKTATPISAQQEGSWYVKSQEQLFEAHRGERVDIYHAPPPAAGAQTGGAGNVNVQIKPILIPKDDGNLIKFVVERVNYLEKKITKGRVPVSLSAVRGTL